MKNFAALSLSTLPKNVLRGRVLGKGLMACKTATGTPGPRSVTVLSLTTKAQRRAG